MEIRTFGEMQVSQEFSGAVLPDMRLRSRLNRIVEKLSGNPTASFPDLFAKGAELEGFYRFVRNPSVDFASLLQAHREETLRRAETSGLVLAVHDTTEFSFQGARSGFGLTSTNARGFYFHASLLVAASDEHTPLGLAQTRLFSRTRVKHNRSRKAREADPENEGKRWLESMRGVARDAATRFKCIHIADREADAFDLLSALQEEEQRFVIRARANRLVIHCGKRVHLRDILLTLQPRVRRQIQTATRTISQFRSERRRSMRPGRSAVLAFAAAEVTIASPAARRKGSALERINLVHVSEENPPVGEKPIEWILWTSEPIERDEDLEAVVDYYRARWVIEEYFKALKSGCLIEKRQLETMATMSVALALFVPIAWKMLLARTLAHTRPDSPSTELLTNRQRAYLEKKYGTTIRTASDAFTWVAQLGGHLPQNGNPGWITLARGFEKLNQLEEFLTVLRE